MARDRGLEELISGDLAGVAGLVEKGMFGGWVWMWRGNLLCGARADGVLYRLGRGNDGWTEGIAGLAPMVMGERRMQGWVRLSAEAAGDDALRGRLMTAAKAFVGGLPAK